MRLLYVEDNPSDVDLMARACARLGVDLTIASTAMEAVEFLDAQQFDFVLLDALLPDSHPSSECAAGRNLCLMAAGHSAFFSGAEDPRTHKNGTPWFVKGETNLEDLLQYIEDKVTGASRARSPHSQPEA